MPILLGLTAALGWGASDYFGGDATRSRTPVLVVVAVAELLGLLLLVPVLAARGVAPPASGSLLLAALAGVAVTIELSLIYRALSQGLAFITAPIGALGAAGACAIGLVGGDPLSPIATLGLIAALVGGGVSAWSSPTSSARGSGPSGRLALTCLCAAGAVASTLTALHAAGKVDPLWATATEHLSTAMSAALAAGAVTRRPLADVRPRGQQWSLLILVAVVGVAGDLAYTTASRHGALSIVSALSSLYPVMTIALGRVLRHQRAARIQLVGIGLALGGAAVLGAAAP